MSRQAIPRHTEGPRGGDALFVGGMVGVHAVQLVGLVATAGWLCPRIWAFLYDVFVLRPAPSAAQAESLCRFCNTHWAVVALATGAAVAADWVVVRHLLRRTRPTRCLVYCIAVSVCILLLQGFVLYGLGSASLQVHSMGHPGSGP